MFDRPIDLAKARILVTNDDGVHATGIKILERIAHKLSKDVWVVAPESEQSAVSHSLTIRRPLRVRQNRRRRYVVDGTPTDCVLLAINHILKDHKPDLVLSGINRGGNIGDDVTYSGTVAAAMEATLLGVPAIALSQDIVNGGQAKWETCETHAAAAIKRLCGVGWPRNTLINVNFPDLEPGAVKGMRVVRQGIHKIGDELVENRDPRGVPYFWVGVMRSIDKTRKHTDLAAIKDGYVSVTPLFLDLTHNPTLKRLKAKLG
jgi:5'-nucleotidase